MIMPRPCSYGGARESKELENFLFDMEQYFHVVRLESKEVKVTTTTMYLISDAKLWWQMKYEDIIASRCAMILRKT